jgi:hypothetical protein
VGNAHLGAGRDWGLVRTRGSGAFESDWTGADDETRWKALPDLSRIYKPHLPLLFPSPHARRRCTPTATNREKKSDPSHHPAPRFPRGHHEFLNTFPLRKQWEKDGENYQVINQCSARFRWKQSCCWCRARFQRQWVVDGDSAARPDLDARPGSPSIFLAP